jgi:hypothetical protein
MQIAENQIVKNGKFGKWKKLSTKWRKVVKCGE